MKIVSYINESFQEFENHISLILFFFGCNIKCLRCYNYSFVTDPTNILPQTPYEIIDQNVNPLIDGLVLIGGEPSVYGKSLFGVAKYAKDTYTLDTKLFTNGSRPEIVLEGLRKGFFDFVSIDYKSIDNALRNIDTSRLGFSFERYHTSLVRLLEQIKEEGFSDRVEIRTTQFKGMSDGEVLKIQEFCNSLGLKHILQPDMFDSYTESGMLEQEK
jgi:pyruvate-formate lyase-activating enzyme